MQVFFKSKSVFRISLGLCLPIIAFAPIALALTEQNYREVKCLNLKQDLGTKSDWHVSAFEYKPVDTDKSSLQSEAPCHISFWKEAAKKTEKPIEIKSASGNGGLIFNHQTVKELRVAAISSAKKAVVAAAVYSGGGSGSRNRVFVWLYDQKNDSFTAPAIAFNLTEQGDYKIFDKGDQAGLLVTADRSWQKNETHFEPHKYQIDVYKLDQAGDRYAKSLSFLTTKKYQSDDPAPDLISAEMARVKQLLASTAKSNRFNGSYRSPTGAAIEIEQLSSVQLKFTGLAQKDSHHAYVFALAKKITDQQYQFKKGTAVITLSFTGAGKLLVGNTGDLKALKFDGISLAGSYKKTASQPKWNVDAEDTPWQSE